MYISARPYKHGHREMQFRTLYYHVQISPGLPCQPLQLVIQWYLAYNYYQAFLISAVKRICQSIILELIHNV